MSAISLAVLLKVLETGSAEQYFLLKQAYSSLDYVCTPIGKVLGFVRQYYRGYEVGYAHIRTDKNRFSSLTYVVALHTGKVPKWIHF